VPRRSRPQLLYRVHIARSAFGAIAFALLSGASASTPGNSVAQARGGFAWPPAQVRELIAAVEEARGHGLDPADYGLAALRAELDLCERLWETPGSRQLDMLARSAALALARDYRRRGAGQSRDVRPEELDAALAAGRLRPWLARQGSAS
jgi:hypothetical protein